jgi:hypothetical protein
MPFEVQSSFNYITNKIGGLPGISAGIKNPVYSALLIAVAVFVIVLFVFRDTDTGDSSLIFVSFRASVYSFVFAWIIMFLNNKVLLHDCAVAGSNERMYELLNTHAYGGAITEDGAVVVAPDSDVGHGLAEKLIQITIPKPDFSN